MMRASQNFDIDWVFGSASSKAVELRLGWLEALVTLGHTPVILNNLNSRDEKLFNESITDLRGKTYYDYGFLSAVEYSPREIGELDVVFVEGSIDNVHFGSTQFRRLAEVITKFSGPIIIFHHGDQNCSVPIGEIRKSYERTEQVDSTKSLNFGTIFKDTPWRPEQWGLWTPGQPDLLINLPSTRRGYNLIDKNKIRQISLGYSPTFDVRRNPDIKWNPKATFVYVGDERSPDKISRMESLYGSNCEECSTILYGEWKNVPKNFDYRGFIPGFGLVYSLLPQATSSITVVREWCTRFKLPTTRTIQTIRAGLLTFIDSAEKDYMKEYIDEFFFIDSHEEYHEKIKVVNLLKSGLNEAIEYQNSLLKTWEEILGEALVSLE